MNINKIYAGIGSRETPEHILYLFQRIGKFLAKNDFILRSGHADGADMAFELGCDVVKGKKEIFLPWPKFNKSNSILYEIPEEAFKIASKYYKHWDKFKLSTQKLLARNCQQVLGQILNNPVDFILCYTDKGQVIGGTATALKIAEDYNIKVFNAGSYNDLNDFRREFYNYLKDNYKIT